MISRRTPAVHALITGGTGFIGSHLVERLVKDGHHVTVLDNFPFDWGVQGVRPRFLVNVERKPLEESTIGRGG